MFHRFSVLPVEAHRRQRPVDLCSDVNDHGQNVRPRTNRHNTKRACERCRMHRIKCGEKKPCTQCVSSKAECIVAYALTSAPHSKKNGPSPTIHKPLCVLPCCLYLEILRYLLDFLGLTIQATQTMVMATKKTLLRLQNRQQMMHLYLLTIHAEIKQPGRQQQPLRTSSLHEARFQTRTSPPTRRQPHHSFML